VRFDPEHDVLKTMKHKRSREALEAELRNAPEAIGRASAARELGNEGSPDATAALKTAMLGDKFWGVQADAANSLGSIRTADALEALLEGLKSSHPKARRAVMRALGNFRDDSRAASALADVLEKGDESYFVEAEAAFSLGKTRDTRAFEPLNEALKRESYLDVIRAHALGGLAETRDERAIEIAHGWLKYGQPPRTRLAAIGVLARFAALKENRRVEILDWLTPLCDDREFMVRTRIPGALADIGDQRALPALHRLASRDLDGRVQRHANDAIASINEGRTRIEEGQRLREDIDKVRDENKKLRTRLEKLEALTRDK
jgi:aminopeptidase N